MKLLVVDGERQARRSLQQIALGAGHECLTARGVDEALQLLAHAEHDDVAVVLLEILLPGRSGWELLDELRERDPAPPVIVVTALSRVDDRVKAFRHGADDFVARPFHGPELLARVESVHRRFRAIPTLHAGPLQLDVKRRTVRRGGAHIAVTPLEFDVLRLLVEADGRVVSKQLLLQEVWGLGVDPGTTVVEVAMSRLRRRLGKDGVPRIRTTVGHGYCLSLDGGAGSEQGS